MLKIPSQKRDPMVPPISISALFDISCINHQNNIVIDQKDLTVTRKKFKSDRKTLAKALLQLGIKRGDIITIATGRSLYDTILVFLAANKIGAVVSILDDKTPRETLLHYLEQFNSPLLVTYQRTEHALEELKKDAKSVKHIINLDGTSTIEGFNVGKTTIPKIASKFTGKIPNNTFKPKNPALISFTSGSTSGPKPMIFTNESIVSSIIYTKIASKFKMWDKENHSWMSYVHFDCPYGFVTSVITPIMGGGKIILTPDICPENFEYYFAKQPNAVFGIPSFLELMQKHLSEDVDLSQLKTVVSGGERLEPTTMESTTEFLKNHHSNAKIYNGYGVGESLGLISTNVGTNRHPNSVGLIPAGVHVAIIDPETKEELGFNKVGLLCVGGKHMMSGYHNRPELSEEKTITLGKEKFINTGDLAFVAESGYVTLVGRATFFINNLPAKVYYEVVRVAVSKSPLVKKSYVVKKPDDKLGYASCAFVVLNEDVPKNNTTRKQIIEDSSNPFQFGKQRLTLKSYEIPREVVILDDLPLTRANKTDFRKLEQMAKEL